MTTRIHHPNGQLAELWDDATRTYRTFSEQGVELSSRPYDTEEHLLADVLAASDQINSARAQFLSDLRAGVSAIVAARESAQSDIATAEGLRAQALTLSGQIQTDVTALQGASLAANTNGMNTLRNAIVTVANRQKTIVDAMAAMYAYRKAVDENAVLTDNAILWLARLTTDKIID